MTNRQENAEEIGGQSPRQVAPGSCQTRRGRSDVEPRGSFDSLQTDRMFREPGKRNLFDSLRSGSINNASPMLRRDTSTSPHLTSSLIAAANR